MRLGRVSKNIPIESGREGWYLTFSFLGVVGIICATLLILSLY